MEGRNLAGPTEAAEHGSAVIPHHDVLGLHGAVHQPEVVEVGEGRRHGRAEGDDGAQVEGAGDGQIPAAGVQGRQRGGAVGPGLEPADLHHPGVGGPAQHLHLVTEPARLIGIARLLAHPLATASPLPPDLHSRSVAWKPIRQHEDVFTFRKKILAFVAIAIYRDVATNERSSQCEHMTSTKTTSGEAEALGAVRDRSPTSTAITATAVAAATSDRSGAAGLGPGTTSSAVRSASCSVPSGQPPIPTTPPAWPPAGCWTRRPGTCIGSSPMPPARRR